MTSNFKMPRAYFHEANVKTNIMAKYKFLISQFPKVFEIVILEQYSDITNITYLTIFLTFYFIKLEITNTI